MQPTPLHVMDSVGPALGAVGFVLLMSLVKEPVRHRLNAVAVAGTAGLYISGGFGPWELLYPVVLTPVAYLGHARGLGHRAPPLGQPDLAVHADLVVGLHDLRLADRGLVLRGRPHPAADRALDAAESVRAVGLYWSR